MKAILLFLALLTGCTGSALTPPDATPAYQDALAKCSGFCIYPPSHYWCWVDYDGEYVCECHYVRDGQSLDLWCAH